MTSPRHVPVLLDRVVALLAPSLEQPGSVLVDCTLGLGGHSEAVLSACPNARVIGIDRDPNALRMAGERLAPFGDRFTGVHAVYDEILDVIADLGLPSVQGVLFDLGVSSMQLDVRERGFAYAEDAPLDMRMNDGTGMTAADILNTYPVEEIARILQWYGEEKFARKIARAIVAEREKEPWTRSGRLVELLYAEIPAPARRTGGHPAKRTFQALRIEVNDEIDVLRRAIPASLKAVAVGGRVVVESYHSLEDRLVKQAFTAVTRLDVPHDMPVVPADRQPVFVNRTRGAEKAVEPELTENPRAASVRLRAVERVREGALS
ncbi:16S rRNA (cytosine(1402)-N(4))-methyltransferase RsmH [Nocardioides cavernaquae]|uniref:Ribosomal RNA small subunit methyltransferase H n=1 Tax=Nocardioides cavernaquae TaxID=2321396 RepID=A0A3A5H1T8_9ACTN|nr:16S rRNA (cytosine(1402)-N(4))-methyltransferase RsmH [Nocardioides cavernaquae]RJS44789.1 16S rRNA (cytosine(1402)-N(4))-methyltransferase RsmH [Nocardioides cavernaquae]RJS47669.1 16S rRNA (cytosine(1402)-N(4))-methyltransferase RsmH [Nocardioides cavernaquae]